MARRRRERDRPAVRSADPGPGAAARRFDDDAASVMLLIVLAAAVNYCHPRITDPDSFYHLRHAWLYATEGLTHTEFPWTQFSVIRTLAADLWYGLHVLMIPLTWMADPIAALKLGSFLTTTAALLLFYVAQRRAGAAWPLAGTLVFLFATADLLYRITMLRPHPISLSLTVLAFADLTVDPPDRERARLLRLAIAGALVAWLHLAVAWLPLLVAAAAAVARWGRRQPLDLHGPAALTGGVIAGALLRPHAWGALKLAYIQVAYLSLQHQGRVPLRFGFELRPLHWSELYKQLIGLMLLQAVALVGFVVLRRRRVDLGTGAWCSLMVWPVFFILAFVVFRRANEVMVAFAVTFIGLVAARARAAVSGGLLRHALATGGSTAATLFVVLGLLIMPVTTLRRFSIFLPNAFDPDRFREVSAWVAAHSAPGEIVFSADWDRFGQLFYWNPRSFYIHGMDPIFMYAYDHSLYWKSHFLSYDLVTSFTCGDVQCNSQVGENTHTVLRRDFHASFILVERGRNPKLLAWLASAPGFAKVFETEYEVLFRVDPLEAG
jgi:hypothetical protein